MGHEGRVQRHGDGAVKGLLVLTWGVTQARWPGWQGRTGKRVADHCEELRLSPKDNKSNEKLKQGSDSDIGDERSLHTVGAGQEAGKTKGRIHRTGKVMRCEDRGIWTGCSDEMGAAPSLCSRRSGAAGLEGEVVKPSYRTPPVPNMPGLLVSEGRQTLLLGSEPPAKEK